MIKIIHGEIWSEDFSDLNNLINEFQSCIRFCFSRFNKDKLEFSEIRSLAKTKYLKLNAMQVSDAVLFGQMTYNKFISIQKNYVKIKKEIEKQLKTKLKHKNKVKLEQKLKKINYKIKYPKLIFGSRKIWNEFKSKKITKEQWNKHKNSQLYSRGCKSRTGNLNLRIVNDILRVTIGHKKWISYKLFIPKKFQKELKQLLESGIAYNVRLIRKDDNHFRVIIQYQTEDPEIKINFDNGVIGVDTNPDRIALANITKDGNLIKSETIIDNALLHAKTNKRDHKIGCIVKTITNKAKELKKGIVFENLKFDKDTSGNKKWNRIKSNFVWKKFITQLERKCIENGIQYKKVHPSFTSIIGNLKYKLMYKISIHESAAYVIGRRGLGYNEKLSFCGFPHERMKEFILGTLAGKYKSKRIHSWRLWKALNDNKAVLTGLQNSMTSLKEFVGNVLK